MSKTSKKEALQMRHARIRKTLAGTAAKPRLSVCRTGMNIYAQLIDDEKGETLVSASTVEKEFRAQKLHANVKSAEVIGKTIAERGKAKNITEVVFDRGGFPFHGCVKALAEAARAAGLQF